MSIKAKLQKEYERRLEKASALKERIKELEEKLDKSTDVLQQKEDHPVFYLNEDEKYYFVEEKFNGFHVRIKKTGDKVEVISEEGKEIKNVEPEAKDIADSIKDDFVVDAEMVPYKNNTPLGRRSAIQFVTAKERPSDGTRLVFHAFDIISGDI